MWNPRDEIGLTVLSLHPRIRFYGDKDDRIPYNEFNSWSEADRFMSKQDVIYLPVNKYEHGMVKFHAGEKICQWDDMRAGFIYADKKKIREWYGVKRITKRIAMLVRDLMNQELQQYTMYVNGECEGEDE